MTRERAKELAQIIAAYGEGKEVQYRASERSEWLDCKDNDYPTFSPGVYGDEDGYYRIKPEPKTRPMTRGEVLYIVTTTPCMVVRYRGDEPFPAQFCVYDSFLDEYEYAIIDKQGNPVDGWHKFEVTE